MAFLTSPMASEVGLKLLLCPLGSNIVVRTVCYSVGIVAPVYNTFKAIEKNDPREQRKWLIYWQMLHLGVTIKSDLTFRVTSHHCLERLCRASNMLSIRFFQPCRSIYRQTYILVTRWCIGPYNYWLRCSNTGEMFERKRIMSNSWIMKRGNGRNLTSTREKSR